jgi:hypothetical protein
MLVYRRGTLSSLGKPIWEAVSHSFRDTTDAVRARVVAAKEGLGVAWLRDQLRAFMEPPRRLGSVGSVGVYA